MPTGRRLVFAMLERGEPIMDASIACEAPSKQTRDHREAMDAIRERRKPGFNGD